MDAIEPHQLLQPNAVAFCDLGEGFAGLHHHRAAFGIAALGSAWQHQTLAGLHQLGILDAVESHQLLQANAVALGDLGEGLAGLHHQIGETRQWQGHRQN